MTHEQISERDIRLVKNQLDKLNEEQDEEINDTAIDNPLFPY